LVHEQTRFFELAELGGDVKAFLWLNQCDEDFLLVV
jgi:hypothetical protein